MSEQNIPEKRITKEELYRNQVELLDLFLKNGAISKAQYDKSFGDLTKKMGFSDKTQKEV